MRLEELSMLMQRPPRFSPSRMLLAVSGSIGAALVPHWLNWLRQMYPDVTTHVIVTPSAERFVTIGALRAIATGAVWRDDWDDPALPHGSHFGLDDSTECYGVFPATLDFTMRLASGRSDSPAMMSLQTTSRPVVIAPSFPGTNVVIEGHIDSLKRRTNVAFSQRVPAFSVQRGGWTGQTGLFLPLLLVEIERLVQHASGSSDASGRVE